MKRGVYVDETAHVKRLAADLIHVAFRDLKRPDTTLECALWFVGRDFPFWAELAGLPFLDPMAVFKQLNPRQAGVLYGRMKSVLRGRSRLPEGCGYERRDVVELSQKVALLLDSKAKKTTADYWLKRTGKSYVNRFVTQ